MNQELKSLKILRLFKKLRIRKKVISKDQMWENLIQRWTQRYEFREIQIIASKDHSIKYEHV